MALEHGQHERSFSLGPKARNNTPSFADVTREHTAEEVEQIRYSIHFQLLLGLELITLGSDNLVVVRKMTFIDSDSAYDEDAPYDLLL
jgi:hypothetical protein